VKDLVKVSYYGNDKDLIKFLIDHKDKYFTSSSNLDISYVVPDQQHLNFYHLVEDRPHLLLVDLSEVTNIDKILKILIYEIRIKDVLLIGLWKNEKDVRVEDMGNDLGIHTHFVYNPRSRVSYEDLIIALSPYLEIKKPQFHFYTREMKKEVEIFIPLRVVFFSFDGIVIESEVSIKRNEVLKCAFPSIPDFPFREFYVTETSRINLRYPLDFHAHLDYVLFDEYEQMFNCRLGNLNDLEYLEDVSKNPAVGSHLDEEQVRLILKNFNQLKLKSQNNKEKIRRIIKSISDYSSSEPFKNLVINSSSEAFKIRPGDLWSFPFQFFLVHSLEDNLNVLNTCNASLVTYVANDNAEIDDFTQTFEYVQLRTICSRLKRNALIMEKEVPMVQIYNLALSADELKKSLDYKNIGVEKKQFNFKQHVLSVKSQMRDHGQRALQARSLDRVSPSFFSPMSHGQIIKKAKVLFLSENKITFHSYCNIPLNSLIKIRLSDSLIISVTVHKVDASVSENKYYGIINCLNETEKNKLRKYVIRGD
jgi:hypothetical protein